MPTRSYARLNLPDYFRWTETEATVRVGETVDVHFECNYTLVESGFTFSDSTKAELLSIQQSSAPRYVTLQGNEVGTTTVTVFGSTSTLTLNVIEADDKKFLNKRGLTYFWDKIDDKKQDKLTAGSNIMIDQATNTISATVPSLDNYYTKQETYSQTEVDNIISGVSADIPTKTSDLTNDGASGSSTYVEASELGNYVTLGTNQNITGEKTFVGDKRIKFKGTTSSSKLGFTTYDNTGGETGFLEVQGASNASKRVRLGCYDQNSGGNARDNYVGFQYYNVKPVGGGTISYNLVCPPQYKGLSGANSFAYIPIDFTDGTTTIRAGVNGILDLSPLMPNYSDFSGATASAAGTHGFVPAPAAGDQEKFLKGDGTWGVVQPGTSVVQTTGQSTTDVMSQKAVTDELALKANSSSLSTVATSGNYNDLTNKPTIPTVNNATLTIQKNGTTVNTFSANASSNVTANITTPEIKQRTGGTTTKDITPVYVAGDGINTPMALKTHGDAHTGSFAYVNINEPTSDISEAYIGGYVWDEYEDWWKKISEKKLALYSDIPSVNNGTLTIQKNGTNVATFTANSSSNVTANVSVPTKTSDLTNDSGFIGEVSTITNARIDEIMGVA